MFIECKIKRTGGSVVTMSDGAAYHFAPDPDNRHVALVMNPDHIERFLSISEGYRIAPGTLTQGAAAPIGAKPPEQAEQLVPAPPGPVTLAEAEVRREAAPEAPADAPLNRDALEALYLQVTGKRPHPAAKDETLLTAIKAASTEAEG